MTVLIGSSDTTDFTVATNVNTGSGSYWHGMTYTAVASGIAANLYYYHESDYSESTTGIKLVLCESDGTVIATTDEIVPPFGSGATWITGAVTGGAGSITSSNTYYIGAYATGSARMGWMSHTSTSGDAYIDTISGTYSSLPATLSDLTVQSIENGLFYAESSGLPILSQTAQIDVTITVDSDFPGAAAFVYPLTGDINVALGVNSWQTGRDVQTGAINVIMGVNGTQSGAEATISAYKLQDIIFAGPRRFG